ANLLNLVNRSCPDGSVAVGIAWSRQEPANPIRGFEMICRQLFANGRLGAETTLTYSGLRPDLFVFRCDQDQPDGIVVGQSFRKRVATDAIPGSPLEAAGVLCRRLSASASDLTTLGVSDAFDQATCPEGQGVSGFDAYENTV